MSQTKEQAIKMYDNQDAARAALEPSVLIYSAYETGSYEGSYVTVYVTPDGKIMYDSGGHCSCNASEFAPREVTRAELERLKINLLGTDFTADLRQRLQAADALGLFKESGAAPSATDAAIIEKLQRLIKDCKEAEDEAVGRGSLPEAGRVCVGTGVLNAGVVRILVDYLTGAP